jgi:hypothetical protein
MSPNWFEVIENPNPEHTSIVLDGESASSYSRKVQEVFDQAR